MNLQNKKEVVMLSKSDEKLNENEYEKVLFPVKTTKEGSIYTILLKYIKKK